MATASVEQLPEPAVVEELCRMLGADSDDAEPANTRKNCWPPREPSVDAGKVISQ